MPRIFQAARYRAAPDRRADGRDRMDQPAGSAARKGTKEVIAYTTEIDLKNKLVRTIFRGDINTFVYDDSRFSLEDALKVAAEHFAVQLKDLLRSWLEHAERLESGQLFGDLPRGVSE